jgi:hypothetical protein
VNSDRDYSLPPPYKFPSNIADLAPAHPPDDELREAVEAISAPVHALAIQAGLTEADARRVTEETQAFLLREFARFREATTVARVRSLMLAMARHKISEVLRRDRNLDNPYAASTAWRKKFPET